MSGRGLLTYMDVVDDLMNFNGSASDSRDRVDARAAAAEALRAIALAKNWTILKQVGRIVTNAAYSTGTVTYLQSAGNVPRQMTLSGGTWPTWASQGIVLINNITYRVAAQISTTVIQLDSQRNPGVNILTPATYQIYQNVYPLPPGFRALIGEVLELGSKIILSHVTFDRALFDTEWRINPAQPWMYAFVNDQTYDNNCGIAFSAPPDIVRTYDFAYIRTPRRLVIEQYNTGTVAVSGVTVTGSGTTFSPNHVGCTLRVSGNTKPPTGMNGGNPFAEERIIVGWTNASTVTIDQGYNGSYSGVPFVISDPVDIDLNVIGNAYISAARARLANLRSRTDRAVIAEQARRDLIQAIEADNKYSAERQAGSRGALSWAFRNLLFGTLGADVNNNGA